jgi:hypothetical protein
VVRRKARKRLVREGSPPPRLRAASREQVLDFANDRVESGQTIRVLSFVEAITATGSALNADSFVRCMSNNVWSCGAIRNWLGLPRELNHGSELLSPRRYAPNLVAGLRRICMRTACFALAAIAPYSKAVRCTSPIFKN